MNDDRLRELYQVALARRAAEPGGCTMPPETMLDVLTHKLPEAEHREALLAIMTNPHCRREFELLRAVSRSESRAAGRRLFFMPLSLAAGLALLIGGGMYLSTLQRTPDPSRSGSASQELGLVSPAAGAPADADRHFVWRSVPGAIRYEFNLVTPGGQSIYAATGTDTAVTVPDSARMNSGAELRWWVEATTGDGRQLRSAIRRLRTNTP